MREGWNRRGETDAFYYVETAEWHGDAGAFFDLGEERTRELVDPVLQSRGIDPSSATALDLGCGIGRFTRALGRRFAHVLGVDVSEVMIERAKELHPADRYRNVTFALSDGTSLPGIDDETLDFVFSYEVIQHMPSLDVVAKNLAEVARVLTARGTALLHCPLPERGARAIIPRGLRSPLARAAALAGRRYDPLTDDPTFRGFGGLDPDEIRRVHERSGLRVADVRDDPTHPAATRVFIVAERSSR
jgi:SAM-dependent methyltransferase